MELGWAAQLRSQPGMERVMTAGALLSPYSTMPADHLVRGERGDQSLLQTAALHMRLCSPDLHQIAIPRC
jgi:hypothetical protein